MPADSRQTRKHEQDTACEKHAIPHNIHLIERYQSPEESSEACQDCTEVKLYESLPCLVHLCLFAKELISATIPFQVQRYDISSINGEFISFFFVSLYFFVSFLRK